MKDVCLNSVGCILAYPAFTARTAAELRREMQNKIIMLLDGFTQQLHLCDAVAAKSPCEKRSTASTAFCKAPVVAAKPKHHETNVQCGNALHTSMQVRHTKTGKIVCFNMAFISTAPHVHLGLVMVADGHQGRGLQKLCLLNVGAAHLDWLTLRYHSYPNLQYNVQQQAFHRRVAELMMNDHRKDIGVRSVSITKSALEAA
eukprot:9454-Heterococcus_DN1.PRE.2